MNSKILFTAFALATFSANFLACSDDSTTNNPTNPNAPTSKDTVAVLPNNPIGDTTLTGIKPAPTDTFSVIPGENSPADTTESLCTPIPVEFPLNEFIDVGDVYKATQCNEKVIFLVRHGEREPGIGSESPLTEDGILEAQAMGAKLIGPEDFAFIHSGFVRTFQTDSSIAVGRNQLDFTADTLPQLADGWFLKDKTLRDEYAIRDSIKNVNIMYAKWAYNNEYSDVFYDLSERSQELINLLVKDYSLMPKFTMVASHDQVLMPLTVYATQKQIDLNLAETYNWLNYLAGVAIIINEKNELRFVAIKGGDSGIR